jgi:hypothetical protein
MLVFEDDIDWDIEIDLRPMAFVPESAVVYLGRCWSHCWLDMPVSAGLVRARRSSCMHAVSLSQRAARAYVDLYPYAPADDMLQDLVESGVVDAFAFKPGLFYQNQTMFESTSDHTRADPRTFDCRRSPMVIYGSIVIVLMVLVVSSLTYISSLPVT